MIDQEALAAFSAFVLAFMQRLLFYPGGLFGFAIALLCARLFSHKLVSATTAEPAASQAHRSMPRWASTAALALCWTAWAMAPLPGAQIMSWAPDAVVTLLLLIAGGLLDSAANGTALTSRKASGYGLLLAALIIWLLAGQSNDAQTAGLNPAILIRTLSGVAYLLGLMAAYSNVEFRPTPAGWLGRFFWLALPIALLPATGVSGLNWPTPVNYTLWTGAIVIAVELVLGTLISNSKPARFLANWHWPWGWLALASAMILLILVR